MRLQFLRGDFSRYKSTGVLDDTHLRFFTYFTADEYILSESSDLDLTDKRAHGSVPLWLLRRHVLPRTLSENIDQWACVHWPNLFAGQILMLALKR